MKCRSILLQLCYYRQWSAKVHPANFFAGDSGHHDADEAKGQTISPGPGINDRDWLNLLQRE